MILSHPLTYLSCTVRDWVLSFVPFLLDDHLLFLLLNFDLSVFIIWRLNDWHPLFCFCNVTGVLYGPTSPSDSMSISIYPTWWSFWGGPEGGLLSSVSMSLFMCCNLTVLLSISINVSRTFLAFFFPILMWKNVPVCLKGQGAFAFLLLPLTFFWWRSRNRLYGSTLTCHFTLNRMLSVCHLFTTCSSAVSMATLETDEDVGFQPLAAGCALKTWLVRRGVGCWSGLEGSAFAFFSWQLAAHHQ